MDWLPITSTSGSSAICDTARRTCASCSRVIGMLRAPVLAERLQYRPALILGQNASERAVLAQLRRLRTVRHQDGKNIIQARVQCETPQAQPVFRHRSCMDLTEAVKVLTRPPEDEIRLAHKVPDDRSM